MKSFSARRPIRPGSPVSSPHHRLAGYLSGAVGTAALLAAPQAEAAPIAFTFGFGNTYEAADGVADWSVGGYGFLQGRAGPDLLDLGSGNYHAGGRVYHNSSYNTIQGLPTFFANGTVIGSGGNGNDGYGSFQHPSQPSVDFTSDQLDKNIAFRTTTNNWGWANVSWDEANKVLTVHSAFVESVANAPITIVPEPSAAALLALAGLGGMALRRRRKQSA